MQDDGRKNEDDDFENDLDLDDTDDDDLDADWEDVEESEDDSSESAGTQAGIAGAKRKTFLQKNFSLVVAGIVVIGGMLLLLPVLLRPSMSPSPAPELDALPPAASESAAIDELQMGLPPMPAPMDGQSEEYVAGEADLQAIENAAETPLTPMPDFEASDNSAPAPLPAENTGIAGALDAPVPLSETQEPVLEVEPAEIPDLPVPLDAANVSEETLLEEKPATPALVTETPALPGSGENASAGSAELASLRKQADEAAARAQDAQTALRSAEDKTRAAEEKAAKLESAARSNEKTISDLEKTVETLRKEIASVKAAAQEAGKAQTAKTAAAPATLAGEKSPPKALVPEAAKPSATEKAAAPLVIAPVVDPKLPSGLKAPVAAAQSPEPPKEQAPAAAAPAAEAGQKTARVRESWILRSAQPGRAVIARANTDDLQNVAVGDTIPGLGRIVSIQQESGIWVVRGTQGEVSR